MTKRTPEPEAGVGLARLVYDAAFFIFALVYLPVFLIKGKHRGGFAERFGHVPPDIAKRLAGKRVLWVHAVSVGETVQAFRLIDAMRSRLDGWSFVITVTTSTGREVAQRLKKPADELLYFPVDFRGSVRRFVSTVTPRALVLLETEIWPNLIFELTERSIPIFIVNGRISDKAIGQYRGIRGFVRPVLRRLTGIAVQDERMGRRFVELGARPDKVVVSGNMKFDWLPSAADTELAAKLAGPLKKDGAFLWIAGSTHDGEEGILFDVYKALKPSHPSLRLLVAPRHLERIPSIESKARSAGVVLEKVGAELILEGDRRSGKEDTVYLLNQMGILGGLYRAADVVFVGGSLLKYGGHNLVEPAYFEKPVLFGPFMDNFKEMAEEFKKRNAALEVQDAAELKNQLSRLIEDQNARKSLGSAAKQLVMDHQGATQRNLDTLLAGLL